MEKELPSFESAANARREIPPPLDLDEQKSKNKKKFNEIEARYTPEEIKALADRVSERLKEMDRIPEFSGMKYVIRRGLAIRFCLEISRFRKLSAEEKAIKQRIIKELSSRGAGKTNRKKEIIKKHTVPKGRVFTPAQTENMIAGAKKRQEEDEDRAGQTWEDSDLEK